MSKILDFIILGFFYWAIRLPATRTGVIKSLSFISVPFSIMFTSLNHAIIFHPKKGVIEMGFIIYTIIFIYISSRKVYFDIQIKDLKKGRCRLPGIYKYIALSFNIIWILQAILFFLIVLEFIPLELLKSLLQM